MKANAEGTYTWGEWKLLISEELLEHKKGYRDDFKRMGTAAGMLDIIFQVERQQLSPEAVSQLVTALADIFDPPRVVFAATARSTRSMPKNAFESGWRPASRVPAGLGLAICGLVRRTGQQERRI